MANAKTVTFDKIKIARVKRVGVKLGSEEAHNTCKSLRQFMRSNSADLEAATGIKHQHGAPYGAFPVPVANALVARDGAKLKALAADARKAKASKSRKAKATK